MKLYFQSLWRVLSVKITALSRTQLAAGALLLFIGFFRLFTKDALKFSDALLAQTGDSLLIFIAFFLTAIIFFLNGHEKPVVAATSSRSLDDMLRSHLNLDVEIEKKLGEVVEDTESSALQIINEVRQLYDSANTVVIYMDDSKITADKLGNEIAESVQHLRKVEEFVRLLPTQMKSDLDNVQLISDEINALCDLVGAVKAISMQSHLLSINAAIEGSRAGPSGASFRVVAGEMRKLASNSNEVANQISQGLLRANLVVTGGIASSIAEASNRLKAVLAAADSIQKFQDNFTGISDFYKSRFTKIAQHNKDLALNISEVLGQIQYQDVVSQCVDRMIVAMNQRNALLEDSNSLLRHGDFDISHFSEKLDNILQAYIIEEEKHKHSARHQSESGGDLKIELF